MTFIKNRNTFSGISGFDPWNESTKALAEIIEKEGHSSRVNSLSAGLPVGSKDSGVMQGLSDLPGKPRSTDPGLQPPHTLPGVDKMKPLPPGFTPNHVGAFSHNQSE